MTPAQLRMARAAVRLGVRQVADLAGVAPYTVTRFENEQGGLRQDTADKLRQALQAAGVRFFEDERGTPCVGFRAPARPDEGLRPDQLTTENDR